MNKGESTCRHLRAIRQQIADANDIEYTPAECYHEGECRGTCPTCEAEVQYIERELQFRQNIGKSIIVVGISAGLAMSSCNVTQPSAPSTSSCLDTLEMSPTTGEMLPPEQQDSIPMPPSPPCIQDIEQEGIASNDSETQDHKPSLRTTCEEALPTEKQTN